MQSSRGLTSTCAYAFASNRQLPILNQWKGEKDQRNDFLENRHEICIFRMYTIWVAGMAYDILSKDNFLRVGMTNRQHLPNTVITIQEKKSYFSEHSVTI